MEGCKAVKNTGLFLGQLLIIWLIYICSQYIVSFLHLPIPGSVLGMLLLYFALSKNIITLGLIEKGAIFLTKHLTFLFLPFVVGLMSYGDLIKTSGIQLFVMIAASTIIGMIVTGAVSQFLSGREKEVLKEHEHSDAV
jgi:holin-like protein